MELKQDNLLFIGLGRKLNPSFLFTFTIEFTIKDKLQAGIQTQRET